MPWASSRTEKQSSAAGDASGFQSVRDLRCLRRGDVAEAGRVRQVDEVSAHARRPGALDAHGPHNGGCHTSSPTSSRRDLQSVSISETRPPARSTRASSVTADLGSGSLICADELTRFES
jgi:hypothetical protein